MADYITPRVILYKFFLILLINGGLGFWGRGLGLGFWGRGFQLMGFGAWGVELSGFYGFGALYTLQELKLQGIKIRDGVVFSRYSRAQCFAIKLSDFGTLLKVLCSSVGRATDLLPTGPGFEYQSGQSCGVVFRLIGT